MKKYIDFNTGLRTKATNDFEKDLFKLMNNAVFGKTCESIEKRVDIRLATNKRSLTKLASKVNYNHHTVFDEDMVAVPMNKLIIECNKPLYLGIVILDGSKTLMYRFHYDYIKPKYVDRAELILILYVIIVLPKITTRIQLMM
jgi:hypothetical protein